MPGRDPSFYDALANSVGVLGFLFLACLVGLKNKLLFLFHLQKLFIFASSLRGVRFSKRAEIIPIEPVR